MTTRLPHGASDIPGRKLVRMVLTVGQPARFEVTFNDVPENWFTDDHQQAKTIYENMTELHELKDDSGHVVAQWRV